MADKAPARYISCDLSLYNDGGFLDGQEVFDRIRAEHAAAPPAIATEGRLYEAVSYRRDFDPTRIYAPEALTAELAAFYAETNLLYPRMPACSLVRIENARILDRAIYQLEGGVPRPFYELQRHGDRPYFEWLDEGGPTEDLPDDRDYLLLTSSGTFNWGHWLIDDLARLRGVIACARARRRKLCVLIHGYYAEIDRARAHSLRALVPKSLGITYQMIAPQRTYGIRNLFYVSPVSVHPGLKHPAALDDLAEAGQKAAAAAGRSFWRRPAVRPSRIFVLRRPGRGRVPSNLDAVVALVTSRGYTLFDPEDATPLEQISAFAAADRVVGCMGAAMAGTVFCPPGAQLLYLAPDSFRDPFYWDQAAARRHSYAVLYGPTTDPARPTESDYFVDLDRLSEALDAIK